MRATSSPHCSSASHPIGHIFAEWRTLLACEAAVSRPSRTERARHDVALTGLPDTGDVSVDVTLPPGGRTFPGPVYDLAGGDGRWVVVATTASAQVLARAGARMADVIDDPVIDARLVVRAVPTAEADTAVDDAQQLLGRLGALQMEAWLAAVG